MTIAKLRDEAYASETQIERALWLCTAEICDRLDRLHAAVVEADIATNGFRGV